MRIEKNVARAPTFKVRLNYDWSKIWSTWLGIIKNIIKQNMTKLYKSNIVLKNVCKNNKLASDLKKRNSNLFPQIHID